MNKRSIRTRVAGWIALGSLALTAPLAQAQTVFISASPTAGGGVQYANPAGGTLTPAAPTGFVAAPNTGTAGIQLRATPNAGYNFVGWSGTFFALGAPGDGQSGNPDVFANTDANDYTAVATFQEITAGGSDTVTANVLPVGAGSTTIENFTQGTSSAGGNGNQLTGINQGDSIFITATPNPGNAFLNWDGNIPAGATIGATTLSFDFPGSNLTVTAVFAAGQDTDGDGLTDALEIANGMDPEDPADANSDIDEDGLTARQELLGLNVCATVTDPGNPDTDNDLLRDGWECWFGLDPTSSATPNGAGDNPDGDLRWNVTSGLPGTDFTNLAEYQRFVEINGGEGITPDNFITAMGTSTDPLNPDTDFDNMPDGWEHAYGLDPTDALEDNGANGNPDGDENYVTAAESPVSGMPIDAFTNFEEYDRFATGGLPTSDPTSADTDEDGLPDGWEVDFGLNPSSAAGDDGANGNPDGDNVYSTETGGCLGQPYNNLLEFNAGGANGFIADRNGFTTHPMDPDVDGDGMPDNWEVNFGLDPWFINTDGDRVVDAEENDDADFMADDGAGNIHHDVYGAFGFDPRTAWGRNFDLIFVPGPIPQPNTRFFDNLAEFNGVANADGPLKCDNESTNPLNRDTDGDGIHDGWEWYAGLNPQNDQDAGEGGADDGLNNLAEFECQRLGNLTLNPTWLNKIWPTDPNDPDTDADQLSDGAERAFIDSDGTERGFNSHCFNGSGMNPTSVDTDGDHVPDAWEDSFASTSGSWTNRNGMNATTQDAGEGGLRLSTSTNGYLLREPLVWDDDYDGDGLPNYQEYWTAAVYAWQCGNPLECAWTPGQGLAGYDPVDFFDLAPYEWDWHFFSDQEELGLLASVPFTFMSGEPFPSRVWFSSTDPVDGDSDRDEMDDFYEIFHGHSPLYGSLDLYSSKFAGGFVTATYFEDDIRLYPHVAGHPFVDPDQDGLINADESLQPEAIGSNYLHTDPSPAWITETSYDLSFVNLYYWLGTVPMYWNVGGAARLFDPAYMFSFESMEGYDTDNDIIPDEDEILSQAAPGNTDPVDMEDPIRERFLYLDGTDAAARTRGGFYHGPDTFQNFTLEAWIRPINPANGQEQIVVERPIWLPSGNPACGLAVVQLNYRLGLLPDGRPFVQFSNNGCNPQVVTAEAGPASALAAEEWAHLSATFDGEAGQLKLYIDGELERTIFSSQRPANGFILPDRAFSGPLVIGARENDPGAWVTGTPIVSGPLGKIFNPPGAQQNQPDLDNHFQGWIDQLRIWDGARTQQEIIDDQFRRLKRADVVNSISNRVDGTPLTPILWNLYSFDDMTDPDHDPIIPQGFDLLNGRPNDGTYPHIPWWATANDRSTVYTDYLYIPWIENTAAHVPLEPPADSHLSTNTVPNTSNPYTFGYTSSLDSTSENHPDFINSFHVRFNPRESSLFNDLLPLNSAVADQDVITWRGDFIQQDFDTDGDGMPDDWETAHGLDPEDATGVNGADGDPDGDGVSNLNEYLVGTDPFSIDSDGDGLPDGLEDHDGDGLTTGDEEDLHGTDPSRPDTDDDGIGDAQEIANRTLPTDAMSPWIRRAVTLDGVGDYVELPDQTRFGLTDWTIEAWIRPDAGSNGGTIIRRVVQDFGGLTAVNYGLEMDAAGQIIGYYDTPLGTRVAATNAMMVKADGATWSHVAATWDTAAGVLRVYVNSDVSQTVYSGATPPPFTEGLVFTRAGEEYEGWIDEVRVWDHARTPAELAAAADIYLLGSETGLVAVYTFDDGSSLAPKSAEDSLETSQDDWTTDWENAGTLVGDTDFVDLGPIGRQEFTDTDGDLMPDWWEIIYGLDPNVATGATESADADIDGDLLTNLYEYYASTDPRWDDTDGDGVLDWGEDFDGDGLVNLDEQSRGSDPRLPDTDDDGFLDFDEVTGGTNPTNSLSPLVSRVLRADGGAASYVRLPLQDRFALMSWTIEAWVKPVAFAADARVISREVDTGIFNYSLHLDGQGRAVAKFTASDGSVEVGVISPSALALNEWTHLSASFDEISGRLWLEMDGVEVASAITARQPASTGAGCVSTRVGQLFDGCIDEVRIWSAYPGTRDLDDLAQILTGTETGLVSYLRFEDDTHWQGTSAIANWTTGQVQDFAMPLADWLTAWENGGTLVNGVLVIPGGPDAPVLGSGGIGAPQAQDCPSDGLLDLAQFPWTLRVVDRLNGATVADATKEWYCTTNLAASGLSSICAGGTVTNQGPVLGDDEETQLTTTVVGPGEICFSYRVATEGLVPGQSDPTQADYLVFRMDNGTLLLESGLIDWTNVCFSVPAGAIDVQWAYAKDHFGWLEEDLVCVDNIAFIHTGPDTDGDSLPDAYEPLFGTNPLLVDTDNDGTWDGAEIANGSDPLTPEIPIISSVRVIGGKVCVEWMAEAGRVYQIQKSYDLSTWLASPNGLSPDEKSMQTTLVDGLLLYCDPESPETPQPSYRVIVLP